MKTRPETQLPSILDEAEPQTATQEPSRNEAVPRILAAAALATLLAVAAALADPALTGHGRRDGRQASLPPPARVSVDVLNGAADAGRTRRVAARIEALSYRVGRVRRADRSDYPVTAVYYRPGGKSLARRLAEELHAVAKPLPGGRNPRHLTVVVGTT